MRPVSTGAPRRPTENPERTAANTWCAVKTSPSTPSGIVRNRMQEAIRFQMSDPTRGILIAVVAGTALWALGGLLTYLVWTWFCRG